ncbi:MAG: hypothetical protein KAQ69_05965 [Spirochaetales bacterium]|nr:hypothetical protein [Spirochaetales bacterium]
MLASGTISATEMDSSFNYFCDDTNTTIKDDFINKIRRHRSRNYYDIFKATLISLENPNTTLIDTQISISIGNPVDLMYYHPVVHKIKLKLKKPVPYKFECVEDENGFIK